MNDHKKNSISFHASDKSHLELLASLGPAVIFSFIPKGDFPTTYVSSNIYDQFGYKPKEFLCNPSFWNSNVHPDDLPSTTEDLKSLFETGKCVQEYRFKAKDGEYRWMHSELLLISDPDGNPAEVLGSWLDITERKNTQQKLRDNQERLETLLSLGTAVIYACKVDGDCAATYISNNVTEQLGYTPSDFLEDPSFWSNNIHPDDKDAVFSALPGLIKKRRHTHQYRFRHKNGDYRWMRDELRLVLSKNGEPTEIIGSWIDITDSKNQEQRLRNAKVHLAEAQRLAHLGSWSWDIESGALTWSDEVFKIFDLPAETTSPDYGLFLSKVHPEDRPKLENALKKTINQHTPYAVEHRIVLSNGSIHHVLEQGEVKLNKSGEAIGMTGTVLDITERKIAEIAIKEKDQHLKYLTHYDSLTDLPNRLLFHDRLSQAINKAKRNKTLVAVLLIDLDNFKKVNDTSGHQTGDILLRDVAARLKSSMRDIDTLARISGDEFVAIIENPASIEKIAYTAQRLLDVLTQPFAASERQFFISASMGISVFPNNAHDVEELLKSADVSMYAAKKRRNDYQFYSPEMDARAHELLLLENDLRRAVEREELVLHYQPQIDLTTGNLIGLEALLRWQHPEKGLLPPGEFIPLAEDSGLILPIGAWVLRTACAQVQTFIDAGLQPFKMCVNISVHQFKKFDFPEFVINTLKDTGLEPCCLELEITESIAMENADETVSHLSTLRERGVRVAIDDFGIGHSSLSRLKHLPITTLKIDKGFVADVLTNQYDFAIIEAILALAKSLNLSIVAEGIETKEQQQVLSRLGCHTGQGYYFCRPQPWEELLSVYKQ